MKKFIQFKALFMLICLSQLEAIGQERMPSLSTVTLSATQGTANEWSPDRLVPDSFKNIGTFEGRSNVLRIGLDGAQGTYSWSTKDGNPGTGSGDHPTPTGGGTGFFALQGRTYYYGSALSGAWTVSADLWIPSTWSDTANGLRRAELWVLSSNAGGTTAGLPAIGFTNEGSSAKGRFRWATGNWNETWFNVPSTTAPVKYGAWNTFNIEFVPASDLFRYYVNGIQVASFTSIVPVPGFCGTCGGTSTGFNSITMQTYNYTANNGGYNVHWSNSIGQYWSGTGTWNASNTNWGMSPGGPFSYSANTGVNAIFAGTAGTVTVSSPNNPNSMKFIVNGYTLSSGTITFNADPCTITTDSGISATISSELAGSGIGMIKAGAGTLTLSGANTYSGATTISSGTLQLGASNVLPNSSVVLQGGTLSTGASTGFSDTLGVLTLSGNSTLNLGTGSHNLNFANSSAASWTAGSTLTVTGWTGTCGNSGTSGRIFLGNSTSGLTPAQLAQITFSGYSPGAMLLSTGELIPDNYNCFMYLGGNGDGHATAGFSSPAPVPVTWLHFNAKVLNAQSVLLQWATAMELNNSHFEVERSHNGHDFAVMAIEEGKGSTQNISNYNVVDSNIPAGVKVLYYRVRQVDFDGQSEHTPVAVVRFEDTHGAANNLLNVFPNPIGEELRIMLTDAPEFPLTLSLSDLSGRLIYSTSIQTADGVQVISLPGLPAGIYLLKAENARVQQTLRVVKY